MGRRTPRTRRPSACPGSACPAARARWSARSPRCAASSQETGYDRVVLCGMGGSSLAPEVICATAGVADRRPRLLRPRRRARRPDRPRPHRRRRVEQVRLARSRPTASAAPSSRPSATRASTPPSGSSSSPTPAARSTSRPAAAGYRVVNADPDVGGRYSALTAFGLVPSGLAGADIEALLDDAEAVADLLAADDEANPALRLGAAMAGTDAAARQARPRRRRHRERRLRRLGRAAHRRVHRQGGHRHPARRRDRRRRPRTSTPTAPSSGSSPPTPTTTPARAATSARHRRRAARGPDAALGGRHRRRRPAPRHQPLRPARRRERQGGRPRACSTGIGAGADAPAFTDGAVEVRALGGDWLGAPTPSTAAVDALLGALDPEHGYVAVMAYLDREADADLENVARDLARAHRPSGDLRLGAAVPALDRAVPQGRPGHRRLPAGHGDARRRPRRARPRLHLRAVHRRAGRPATRRCSPTTAVRCCACTSPTTTPGWPRSAPPSAEGGA